MSDYFNLPLSEKLEHFQTRLAAQDLTPEQASDLLAVIHADLETPNDNKRTDYEQYARFMQSFRNQAADLYKQVVTDWQQKHQGNEETSEENDEVSSMKKRIKESKKEEDDKEEEGEDEDDSAADEEKDETKE